MNVVDANVLLSGLRSANGASNVIVRAMILGSIRFAISPAVALEYEDLLKRRGILGRKPWITLQEIDTVLDAIFKKATLATPWFRYRPLLADPKDDLYIECALASGASAIITNDRHFDNPAVAALGISVVNAGAFVDELRRERRPK